jgi:hypothetical protein
LESASCDDIVEATNTHIRRACRQILTIGFEGVLKEVAASIETTLVVELDVTSTLVGNQTLPKP